MKRPAVWAAAAAVLVCVGLVICFVSGVFSGKGRRGASGNEASDEARTGELFDIIMSSPQTSSNSWDYLDAHEAEHKELLKDKENTLRYIFTVFLAAEKSGQPENGLKGVLMRIILDEIAPYLMLDLVATPQDYFSAWKDMALQQQGDHDDKWLKKNYPAAYILKQML